MGERRTSMFENKMPRIFGPKWRGSNVKLERTG
jgi:hypothetical protein